MQRFKDLVNISAVSKQEFEDAEAAYKQALADVGVNKAAVENARIRLAYTKVTSPISGRSGRSLVTPGALVTENQEEQNVLIDAGQLRTWEYGSLEATQAALDENRIDYAVSLPVMPHTSAMSMAGVMIPTTAATTC